MIDRTGVYFFFFFFSTDWRERWPILDISLAGEYDPMVHGRSSYIENSIQHCLRIEFKLWLRYLSPIRIHNSFPGRSRWVVASWETFEFLLSESRKSIEHCLSRWIRLFSWRRLRILSPNLMTYMSFDISPWHGQVEYSSLEAQATKRFHGKTHLTIENLNSIDSEGRRKHCLRIKLYLLAAFWINKCCENLEWNKCKVLRLSNENGVRLF